MIHIHKYEARIQMPNAFAAEVVAKAVSVDPELRPDQVNRTVSADGCFIVLKVDAKDVKSLRTAVTSIYDFLIVSVTAVAQFAA